MEYSFSHRRFEYHGGAFWDKIQKYSNIHDASCHVANNFFGNLSDGDVSLATPPPSFPPFRNFSFIGENIGWPGDQRHSSSLVYSLFTPQYGSKRHVLLFSQDRLVQSSDITGVKSPINIF